MIRVQALGGLRIFVRGEESVTLSKQRLKSGLLVYLAVERSCMREVLIGTFWPEREPERARHVLSQAVYDTVPQADPQPDVRLHLPPADDAPRVPGDSLMLREAFKNLIDNVLWIHLGRGFSDSVRSSRPGLSCPYESR